MSLRLVLGPANAGKAGRVLGALRSAGDRERIVCLPRAADVELARRELAAAGAALGVRALNFPGLVDYLAERLEVADAPLSQPALALVTRRAIESTELVELAAASKTPGFVSAVVEALAEFDQAAADPERLAERSRRVAASGPDSAEGRELRELLAIHRRRREFLERIGRATDERRARLCAERLSERPKALYSSASPPLLGLYGYDDFMPVQRDLLKLLSEQAGWDLIVSLPYERRGANGRDGVRPVFAAVAATVEFLRPQRRELVEELPASPRYYRGRGARALHRLERGLFEPAAGPIDPEGAIEALRAGGGEAERELVAESVARLIEEDGFDPREIAVVVPTRERSLEVGAALAALGVEHTVAARLPLPHTPLGAGLVALARTALSPEATAAEEILRYLRLPGIAEPARVDYIEEQLRRRGLTTARELLELLASGGDPSCGPRGGGSDRLHRTLEGLREAARQGVDAFCERLDRELDRLLAAPLLGEAAAVAEKRPAGTAVHRATRRVLRELASIAAGGNPLGLEPSDVLWALERALVESPASDRTGRVTVASPAEVRARRWRAVIVTGLEAGSFPRSEPVEGVFGDAHRKLLADSYGLRLEAGPRTIERERFLFYACCSRAEERLVVSSRECDDDGRPLEPSPFLRELRRLMPKVPVRRRRIGELPSRSLLLPRPQQRRRPPVTRPLLPSELTKPALRLVVGNDEYAVADLERFAQCRAAWLIERVVRPRSIDPDTDALVAGTIVHGALRRLYSELFTRPGEGVRESSRERVRKCPREQVRAAVRRAAREHLGEGVDLDSPRLRPLLARAAHAVTRALRLDTKLLWGKEFEPRPELLEVSFGGDKPPLELAGIKLRGRIDRIDVAPAGDGPARRAVIVDYKTGRRDSGAAHGKWLERGVLQAGVYMLAARELRGADGAKLAPEGGIYAFLGNDPGVRGALSDGAAGPGLSRQAKRSLCLDADELEELLEAVEERVAELVGELSGGSTVSIEPNAERCSSRGTCSYPGFCRLEKQSFVAGSEGGAVYAEAAAADRPIEAAAADPPSAASGADADEAGSSDAQATLTLDEVVAAPAALSADDLTPEQQKAVKNSEDPLVVVAAGAGVGKTRVLVERYVKRLRDELQREPSAAGAAVERLVAITFTEKAAAEMRERIAGRLRAIADRERDRTLADAVEALEGAPISTVHSFCARLLRKEAVRAGLDPHFRVLDEHEQRRVAERALDLALERFTAAKGEVGDRAAEFMARYGAEQLRSDLQAVHGALRAGALPPPGAFKSSDASNSWCPKCGLPFFPGARAQAANGADRTSEPGGGSPEADEALFSRALHEFAHAYADELERRSLLDFDDLERRAVALLEGDPAVGARWRGALSEILVDEAQDLSPLQHRLLRALHGGEGSAGSEGAPAGDGPVGADGAPRPTLFLVGDERQSIYGFRHAEVALFTETTDCAEKAGALIAVDTNFRSHPALLDVVNGTFSQLWGEPPEPSRESRQRPSWAARHRDLKPGREAQRNDEGPRVDLLVVAAPSKARARSSAGAGGGAQAAASLTAREARQAEAWLLADYVWKLAHEEAQKNGAENPGEVQWDSWALLLRSSSDAVVFERALVARGIPVYNGAGRGFFAQLPVHDVLNWLRVLANPRDETALAELLLSPLVGLEAQSIAWLALAPELDRDGGGVGGESARRPRRGSLWERLRRAAELGSEVATALSKDQRELLEWVVATVEDERASLDERPLEELIERCLELTGYHSYLLSLPDGVRRLANVRKLRLIARAFERVEGRDLRGFCDSVRERQIGGEAREPEAALASEGAGSLRILTIHQSKGLEFDNVIVADLGRTPARGRDSGVLVVFDGGGPRLATRLRPAPTLATDSDREYIESADWKDLQKVIKARGQAEEERLVYVAMTRARERLILSGRCDPELLERPAAPNPRERSRTSSGAKQPSSGASALDEYADRAKLPLADWLFPVLLTNGDKVRVTKWGPSTPANARQARGETVAGETAASVADAAAAPAATVASPEAAPPRGCPGAPSVSEGRRHRVCPQPITERPRPKSELVPRLSYTQLSLYERCGYRYYLERVAGLTGRPEDDRPCGAPAGRPSPAGAQTVGDRQADLSYLLARGRIVHALLERIDLRKPRPPSRDEVTEALAALGVSEEQRRSDADLLCDQIDRWLRSPLAQRLRGFRELRREYPFLLVEPLTVTGVFDLWAQSADGTGKDTVVVVDYKTDRLDARDPAQLVADRYALQQEIYGLAALCAGAPSVEVAHVFLECPEDPVVKRFERAQQEALKSALHERAAGIAAGRFEPTENPHLGICQGCPGRAGLCKWPPELTGRSTPAATTA